MEKPLTLSIIVPVYNAEKYLKQCLDSLLEQDVGKDEYEIICINDGSTDGSMDILQVYAKNDVRIKVIDKCNEGVSRARNLGIDRARGEYIWFVDADDWIARNCLGYIFEILRLEDLGTLHITRSWIKAEWRIKEYENYVFEREKAQYSLGEDQSPYACFTVIRRELIVNRGIRFLEGLHYGEDGLFMLDVADIIRLGTEERYRFFKMEGALVYFYRQHETSAMNLNWTKNRISYTDSLLVRARINKERAERKDMPIWYVNQYRKLFHMRIFDYMMYWLPACGVDLKQTLKMLKRERLYPIHVPCPKKTQKENISLKERLATAGRRICFRIPCLYKLYYKKMLKKYKNMQN